MATSTRSERSVTRTYRAAIRLGEDFITLEETITLPIDADDSAVQQAVELGWRIYRSQREAIDQQIAGIRELQGGPTPLAVRDPDAPASEKQRNYIAALQDELGWPNEQLAVFAQSRGVELLTLTKGQASAFIDDMKRASEERLRVGEERARYSASQPALEKQRHALERLALSRSADLDAETQRRFGVGAAELSSDQAATLLSEWQVPARRR